MIARAILALFVSLALIGCGVKSDLEPPNGAKPERRETDPSKPPVPIGQ
jgi:predicted small lipoprotein YifL